METVELSYSKNKLKKREELMCVMLQWLALRFKDAAIYLDTLRECYEAYVVYNFMAYLLTFLNNQYPDLEAELESKPQVKHLVPFCCFPPWKMGR